MHVVLPQMQRSKLPHLGTAQSTLRALDLVREHSGYLLLKRTREDVRSRVSERFLFCRLRTSGRLQKKGRTPWLPWTTELPKG